MRADAIALSLLVPSVLVLMLGSAIAQPALVQVLTYSSYTDSVGYYHVVGEVQNVGSASLSQVTVAATLCDQSGHSTATIEDYIMIDLLVPQQKSPFDLLENVTGTVCGVSSVNSTITDRLPYRDLQVSNQSAAPDAVGVYHVAGQLENTGSSEAKAVQVVGTFYDANGVVVQAGLAISTPSNLSPGGSGYFDVSSDDPTMSARIANFSLQVQSASPVLPVPEYPAITPILTICTILVLVVARRRRS
jgi:hypothetical protein